VFDRGAGNTITDNSQLAKSSFTTVSGTVYTNSIFLKAATGADVGKQIGIRGVVNSAYSVITLTASWVRYTITETETDTAGQFQLANRGTITADNTVSVHAWQAQCETGSVATSPIVTTAGTASRVADVVSLTGASSLIGQTGGTLYIEGAIANLSTVSFGRVLSIGTDGNNSTYIEATTGAVRGFIITGGVQTQGGTLSESVANNTIFRAVLSYGVGANLGALYVNGAGDVTSPTAVPASSIVHIGSSTTGAVVCVSHIRAVALFPTRLSNATSLSLSQL
jgi:hypothetical protein